jgi:hypothetical protein
VAYLVVGGGWTVAGFAGLRKCLIPLIRQGKSQVRLSKLRAVETAGAGQDHFQWTRPERIEFTSTNQQLLVVSSLQLVQYPWFNIQGVEGPSAPSA